MQITASTEAQSNNSKKCQGGEGKMPGKAWQERENFFILQQKLRQCLFVRSFVRWFVCLFACLFVRLFACLFVSVCPLPFDAVLAV